MVARSTSVGFGVSERNVEARARARPVVGGGQPARRLLRERDRLPQRRWALLLPRRALQRRVEQLLDRLPAAGHGVDPGSARPPQRKFSISTRSLFAALRGAKRIV